MIEQRSSIGTNSPQREQSAHILVRGKFSPDQVQVTMGQAPEMDPELLVATRSIEASRPRSRRKTLVLLQGPSVVDDALAMTVGPMSFAALKAREIGGIGTSIVIVTKDEMLLASELPKKHERRPGGVIQPIGGYPEVEVDDFKPNCIPDVDEQGVWDPFKTIRREVHEETGIDDLTDVSVIGAAHNDYSRQPILIFSGRTNYTSEQIQHLPSEDVPLRFIDNTVEAVSSFLECPCGFSPTGLTSLLLYGSDAFGEDWYHTKIAEIKRTARIHRSLPPIAHEDVRQAAIAYTLQQTNA